LAIPEIQELRDCIISPCVNQLPRSKTLVSRMHVRRVFQHNGRMKCFGFHELPERIALFLHSQSELLPGKSICQEKPVEHDTIGFMESQGWCFHNENANRGFPTFQRKIISA
jgi:hypothetical protein